MQDLHSGLAVVSAIGAAALSATATSAAIDRQGYNSAEIVLSVGVGGITFTGANKIEFKLTHSDDDATYNAVEQKDILGATVSTGGIVKALTAAHAAAASYRCGYIGGRRYLKVETAFSGTHATPTPLGVNVLLGDPSNAPVANQI